MSSGTRALDESHDLAETELENAVSHGHPGATLRFG